MRPGEDGPARSLWECLTVNGARSLGLAAGRDRGRRARRSRRARPRSRGDLGRVAGASRGRRAVLGQRGARARDLGGGSVTAHAHLSLRFRTWLAGLLMGCRRFDRPVRLVPPGSASPSASPSLRPRRAARPDRGRTGGLRRQQQQLGRNDGYHSHDDRRCGCGWRGGAGRAAFAKYTTCLEQHGVTLPTRRPGGFGGGGGNGGATDGSDGGDRATASAPAAFFSGANSAKFRAAQTACSKLLPAASAAAASSAAGGGGGGGNAAAFAAYRNCLTLHGVKLGARFRAVAVDQGAPRCARARRSRTPRSRVRSRRAQACDPASGVALRARRRPRRQPPRREARVDHAPHRELLRAARRAHRGGRVVRVLDDLRHVVVRIERRRAHRDGVARRRAVERVGLGQHLVGRDGLADVRDERHAHVAARDGRPEASRRTRCSARISADTDAAQTLASRERDAAEGPRRARDGEGRRHARRSSRRTSSSLSSAKLQLTSAEQTLASRPDDARGSAEAAGGRRALGCPAAVSSSGSHGSRRPARAARRRSSSTRRAAPRPRRRRAAAPRRLAYGRRRRARSSRSTATARSRPRRPARRARPPRRAVTLTGTRQPRGRRRRRTTSSTG